MAELPQCTAEQVIEVAETVAISAESVDAQRVADHVNHPVQTVERALSVAESLGLVTAQDGSYDAAAPYGHYFSQATETRRIDVLRFALEAFPAYRFFKQRVALHRDPLKAARETKHRFGYTNHEGEVRETLVSLGQFSGSLIYATETGYVVATSEEAEGFLAAAEQIAIQGASVEAFIRELLGEETYGYVQNEEEGIITHLRSALQKVVAGERDRSTVVHIGNACENFLVKVAREAVPAVDLSGATGVTSKAQRLEDGKVIASKHMGYMRFLGHLRNAADHGEDQDINAEWEIAPESVQLGALVLLAAIKSVSAYVLAGRAEF
jgi:hypothetical protein